MSSDPGGLAGSSPEYDVVVRCDVGVAMDDGAMLFADLYMPAVKGEPLTGEWPVLLERSPYDKGREAHSTTGRFFAERGYVYVVQDVRGRYSSDGDFRFLRNEADDGEATMGWLAAQPWCGPIGTLGISYTTATQQALAVRHPPKLTTQALFDGPYNYFRQTMRHGGACEYGIAFQYVVFMAQASKQAAADPSVQAGLDEMWASLTDWLGHQAIAKGETPLSLTPDYEQWFFDMLTTSDYTDYWITPGLSIEEFIDDYPDIPLLLETSWYGHHITATLWKYEQLKRRHRTPKQLIIGTWLHGGDMLTQSFAGDVEFGPAAAMDDNNSLRLRWFDQHLKGLPTGLETEAPVRLFVMGGGSGRRDAAGRLMHGGHWRDEHEWPVARAVDTTFFLTADGVLTADHPAAAADELPPTTYVFDPTDPVPTVGGNFTNYGTSGFLEGGGYDQHSGTMSGDHSPSAPLEERDDVIVFRTPPLTEGVEVTGVVRCQLWVSSSALDTDFTVKLIDEYPPDADYPNGYALNLGDTILRMRYRDGFDGPSFMNPGEIYEIELRLQATSNLFAPGHCIRVDVSSSNFPHYDVNPNTGEPLGLNEAVVTATQA
ncbi:CocE/NonD family hydrolase, partial [Ilumatobacter sp.]|uniref:CocE/NonD family hydrolase n=1 Tax=Ilumatobacter sp. TaxID=1967498 RepID=UPI003AF69678